MRILFFYHCRFAEKPEYYDGINDAGKNDTNPNRHIWSLTRNLQSADFGLDFEDMDNSTQVNSAGVYEADCGEVADKEETTPNHFNSRLLLIIHIHVLII